MKKLVLVLALISAPAFADEASKQTPVEAALNQKLGSEINEGLQLRAALVVEKAKNIELQKKIDDIEAKSRPNP